MGVIFFSRGFIPLNNQFVFVCEIGIKPFHGMNPVE